MAGEKFGDVFDLHIFNLKLCVFSQLTRVTNGQHFHSVATSYTLGSITDSRPQSGCLPDPVQA